MILHVPQVEPHHKLWTKDEYYRLGDLGFFRGQKVTWNDGDIIIQSPEDHQGPGIHYPSNAPQSRLWTKDEYYRLGELGFFEGMKAELLGGEIVVTSPQKWPHYSELDRVADVLRHDLPGTVWIRTQAPLDLGLVIEPEPDVSVVQGCRDDYTAHPTSALLVVEVSETTLAHDRDDKGSLFAKGKVDDYWVVNLIDCQLEVYRKPVPDASRIPGFGYADLTIFKKGGTISLLAFPGILILVDDLLP